MHPLDLPLTGFAGGSNLNILGCWTKGIFLKKTTVLGPKYITYPFTPWPILLVLEGDTGVRLAPGQIKRNESETIREPEARHRNEYWKAFEEGCLRWEERI